PDLSVLHCNTTRYPILNHGIKAQWEAAPTLLAFIPQFLVMRVARLRQTEMLVGIRGGDSAARGALQITLLDQVRLDHILDGVALFTDSGGKIVHADRAVREFLDHRLQ